MYHIHLEGNVRLNPKLAGTVYNVFGIQVGVGITVAIRVGKSKKKRKVNFVRVDKRLRRKEKLAWLARACSLSHVKWQRLLPDTRHAWLLPGHAHEFGSYPSLGDKNSKANDDVNPSRVFKQFSVGVKTNRDDLVYDFNRQALVDRVRTFAEAYNAEVDRFKRTTGKINVDDFVRYESIKWSESLKANLVRARYADYKESKLRISLYRPFCERFLFFDDLLVERRYQFPQIFPSPNTERENKVLVVSDIAFRAEGFSALISNHIPDLHLCASLDNHQCFPFYVYDEDGSDRRENVTDWALEQFRTRYKNKKIAKWDIFYYVYGLLHHAGYREKFADNLKRELPRIPLAPDFKAFSKAGQKLAALHLEYESLEPWPLDWVEAAKVPLSYQVDKMKLNKDKTALTINPSLTLAGIPPETFQYRLGNRSALEWVIDQYQISQDKRSGIRSDPNRADDPEYIVRLVGQVVRVSLETVKIVDALPDFQ